MCKEATQKLFKRNYGRKIVRKVWKDFRKFCWNFKIILMIYGNINVEEILKKSLKKFWKHFYEISKKLFSNVKEVFKKSWKNFRNTLIKFFKYFEGTLGGKNTKVSKKLQGNIRIILRTLKKFVRSLMKF